MAKSYATSKTIEYTGAIPMTISANGSTLADYRVYGASGGVGDETVNLFEVESDMLLSSNWDENPPYGAAARVYFINYKLSNTVTKELKKGIHTCSIFEHFTDGYTPNLLVCAFVPTLTATVDAPYRILTNRGETSVKTFDFSNWQDIYLIIGYSNGFDTEATKQSKIDELFTNWEISIVEGSTAPAEYVPFGYEVDMSISDGTTSTTTPIYIGDEPLEKDEYIDYQAGKIYRYETEIKKDVSQTGWQWRWETDNVTYQKPGNNRVSVGRFYPEEAKEYIISAVPDTFEVAVISADSSDVKTADTGWCASWTLSGASAHSFCVSVRKSDNSNITPSEVDGIKFKVTSLTPTDPPVPLPALPTCDGTTIIDYDGTPKPSQMYVEYNSWSGWELCGAKRYHKSKNLLEIAQDMYNKANWDNVDVYFMYYALPQNVIDVLKNIGTVAGTVYLKTGGEYYSGEVFAITPQMSMTVSTEYCLLLNDGTSLNFSQNVSNWDDVYLCIGYGSEIKPANKQRLINSLFHNFNIMLNEGTTALPYEPYGSWWEDGTESVRRNGVWVQQT